MTASGEIARQFVVHALAQNDTLLLAVELSIAGAVSVGESVPAADECNDQERP
jgi:hypothetical protein